MKGYDFMTIEEAKALMTPEALEHLNEVVCPWEINIEKKDCDIVMSALCRAVTTNVVKKTSLDANTVQILNSDTSTLTAQKLKDALTAIRKHQDVICLIFLKYKDEKVVFDIGDDIVTYNGIFDWVIKTCGVTSIGIRKNMNEKYKASVINNIAQLVPKYHNNPNDPISIKNITRIFTSYGGIITCSIKERNDGMKDVNDWVMYF
jgi:hypothetical protein